MLREPLGNFSNIKSFSGQKSYEFNPKASIPYLKAKRAQNIPDVSYDESSVYSKQISERLAIDTLTSQIKENYENIGYVPKVKAQAVGKIVSSHTNGVKKVGFETLGSKVITSKQIGTPTKSILDTPPQKPKFKLNLTPKPTNSARFRTRTVGSQGDDIEVSSSSRLSKRDYDLRGVDKSTNTD